MMELYCVPPLINKIAIVKANMNNINFSLSFGKGFNY